MPEVQIFRSREKLDGSEAEKVLYIVGRGGDESDE